MANNNQSEKFSRIVEYKGVFDVSQIIASFKKMKQELEGRGASKAETQKLEEEIAKIEQLNKAITRTTSKGFKTPKEFDTFTKKTEQMSSSLQRLATDFEKVNASALSDSIKSAKNQSDALEAKTKALVREYVSTVKQLKLGDSATRQLINSGKQWIAELKEGKNTESQINQLVKEQKESLEKKITAEKEDLEVTTRQVKNLERQKELAQDISNFHYSKDGKSFGLNFLLSDQYIKKEGKTQTALSNEDMQNVTQAIQDTFNSKNANFGTLIKELKRYKIELKDTTSNVELFNEAAKDYRNKVSAWEGPLKGVTATQKQLKDSIASSETILRNLQTAEQTNALSLNSAADAARKYAAAQQRLNAAQANKSQSLSGMQENLNLQTQLNNATERGIDDTQRAISEQQKLDSAFNQISNRISQLLSFINLYHKGWQIIRQTFADIQKIDKAFASIAMVTDYNISDLWEQYDDYAAIANELGQSTEAVIQSSALYYQQGNDLLF